MSRRLDPAILAALKAVDTPTVCNAIEEIEGRRRASGFTTTPVVCAEPAAAAMVGFAKTAKVRADRPADEAPADLRARRLGYYRYVAEGDWPRLVVIEDESARKGIGAFWGEVNVAIHKGLGLQGVMTDGSIRDLGVIDSGFQLLAGCVSPSHAFVHVTTFATTVDVLGLTVRPDDLVHADRHGAVVIEPGMERELPRAIDLVIRKEAPILRAARAPHFNVDALLAAWGEADDVH
ncbi:MAG: RraA family protein [Methylobacteriaceae bacterium]|nr:RraA family protein [Methylobacteriaceae bacterium]